MDKQYIVKSNNGYHIIKQTPNG